MGNNHSEHARMWDSVVEKIVSSLNETDLKIAGNIFSYDMAWLLKAFDADEKSVNNFFVSWLINCFQKENEPLPIWYIEHCGSSLSENEKRVLLAAHETFFDAFKVVSQEPGLLTLVDTTGRLFPVETVDLPPLKKGGIVFVRLNTKENGRFFASSPFAPFDNDSIFQMLKKHREFRDSWHNCLKGFFDYLISDDGLTERTADNHTENANLLMMFLEPNPAVDSFSKVTKHMIKTDFKKFIKKNVFPSVDVDKVYYSLYKFFTYLEEERGIENKEVLNWLRQRL